MATKSTLLLVPDPQASRFLTHDSTIRIVAPNQHLEGYELYVVEQWACSRSDPTCVVAVYSGETSHRVKVDVLSIPLDEASWGSRLVWYSQFLRKFDAKAMSSNTDEPGFIFACDLTDLSSSLSTIHLVDGDVLKCRSPFFLNENLKRLHCWGRHGINLKPPSRASEASFYNQYHVSQKVAIDKAVIALAQMCQTALMLFGLLDSEYIDGLICDITERAMGDWWLEFGAEYYSFESEHTAIDSTTVPALIGLLIGARNRLDACGAPIGKDVFSVEITKRAIAHFQKENHLSVSRRLDRQTLQKLHKATAKAASERLPLRHGVRSKLAEFGKTNEERGASGIADVETVNFEEFVTHVHGATAKYLWQGKMKGDIGRQASILPQTFVTVPDSLSEQSVIDDGDDHRQRQREQPQKIMKRNPDRNNSTTSQKLESNRQLDYLLQDSSGIQSSNPEQHFEMLNGQAYQHYVEPPSDGEIEAAGLYHFGPGSASVSEPSIAGSVYRGVDLEELFDATHDAYPPAFERSRSYSDFEQYEEERSQIHRPKAHARHMSFGMAERGLMNRDVHTTNESMIESARRVGDVLHLLERRVGKWLRQEVNETDELDSLLYQDQSRLCTHLFTQSESYRELERNFENAQEEDEYQLSSVIKDIETLSLQLNHDITAVRENVEDVERAVNEFEGNIITLEDKVNRMEKKLFPKESWFQNTKKILKFGRSQPEANGKVVTSSSMNDWNE